MSRRAPNPAADRAAQNQATIKTLLKLDSNKSCADCKRNKHPRWASWNLGIFVCIRCSGIHRGMGTHISRVKSVDLDAWTDEQLQSVVQWGNTRANRYWEAKLAPGHVPSESKIENFIRTKYESKRWVMDGPKPDPSTLDDGTEPAEAANPPPLDKSRVIQASQTTALTSSTVAPKPSQSLDLFADDNEPPTQRPSTTVPTTIARAPPPQATTTATAPPKQTKPGDSLLGLDFFGTTAPPRPASAASAQPNSGPSRPDLKQSILSLYASAPKPQQQPQHAQRGSISASQAPSNAFSQPAQTSAFGDLSNAFGELSFPSSSNPQSPPTQAAKSSAFAGLGSPQAFSMSSKASPSLSGGGFFNQTPAAPVAPVPQKQRTFSNSSFGAWDSAPEPARPNSQAASKAAPPSSDLGDMLGFGSPESAPAPIQSVMKPAATQAQSVFNLSKAAPPPQPNVTAKKTTAPVDPFGSNDVWGSPDPPAAPATQPASKTPSIPLSSNFGWASSSNDVGGGFGSSAPPQPPKITLDEDFGGWSSAAPVSPAAATNAPPPSSSAKQSTGGFGGGGDDLFGNVWE